MLKYKHGDIVEAMLQTDDIDIVFHQCNCFNNMGAGIAKDLSRVFPQVLSADNTTLVADKSKMGKFSFVKVTNQYGHQMFVFNLYGQYAFKYGTIYKFINGIKHTWDISMEKDNNDNPLPLTSFPHLEQAIQGMIKYCDDNNIVNPRFATVKIGCGRGGGDWHTQGYPLLDRLFHDFDLTVYRF